MKVVGYELLYRSQGDATSAQVGDGDQATTRVILNSFIEIGLDNIIGDGFALINLTRKFLLGNIPIPFPPQRVILEILEDITIDRPIIDALQKLISQGYVIALDDVTDLSPVMPILPLAKIVKIDVLSIPPNNLRSLVQELSCFPGKMLAEKVETQEVYNQCLRMGFDFFQGYFFCKPNVIRARKMDSSRIVIIQSLAKLQDPKADFENIETVVMQDVALSYKLLKLVNSGFYSLPTTVKSIRHAISLIGLTQLRGWMALILLTRLENKPSELATQALMRAKTAELIAHSLGLRAPETYFLTGLLSLMDAFMDIPMQDLITQIPLAPEIRSALIFYEGSIGQILQAVQYLERGEWHKCEGLKMPPGSLKKIFGEATTWTTALCIELFSD